MDYNLQKRIVPLAVCYRKVGLMEKMGATIP